MRRGTIDHGAGASGSPDRATPARVACAHGSSPTSPMACWSSAPSTIGVAAASATAVVDVAVPMATTGAGAAATLTGAASLLPALALPRTASVVVGASVGATGI